METVYMTLSFAVFIFLTIVFSFIKHRRGHQDHKANLPPGSFGWPIIGETIEFLFGKPEIFVTNRMKKYSPDIFKTKILGEKVVVICGPNGNKFLFSNENKLFTAYRPVPMMRLFRSYKDKKAQEAPNPDEAGEKAVLRQPGFLKAEALVGYLGKMDTIIQELFQAHWEGKDSVKASDFAKTVTLTLACRFFLGTDNPGQIARLVEHFDDVTNGMHSIVLDFPGTIFHRANKAAAAIRKELRLVISEKKKEVASKMASGTKPVFKDILSYIILATDPDGKFMGEAEIADKIMGLLVAGYSTVATAITFLVKYLGENPDIYNLVRQEQMEIAASKKDGETLEWGDVQKMKYSWNVLCETMRLTPPLQGTFREVLQDFTYAGYTIPKGWKMYWTVSSTNKDPQYFKDPEKFDPSRFGRGEGEIVPYTYVPFGGGPRTCPGKEYARLAILTFLHNVVKKYRWELLMPDEKIIGDMMPTPANGLPIRFYHL